LWVHTVNQHGQLSKLTPMPTGGPMACAAPDELTLVRGRRHCLQLLQLACSTDKDAIVQAPPDR